MILDWRVCVYSRVEDTLSVDSKHVPLLCKLGVGVGLEMLIHIAVQVGLREIVEVMSKEVPEKVRATSGEVGSLALLR